MLKYPSVNPVALQVGPVAVHWYGIFYMLSFMGAWALLRLRIRNPARGFTPEQLSDIIFYTATGVVFGGRIGYMLFYGWSQLMSNPLSIFAVWQGGMSFHGGLIGVLLMMGFYAHKSGKRFGDITDLIAPVVPIGLGLGRLGNFINGELWGKVTTLPWGMAFPTGGPAPRHPSQLYELLLEGVVLFVVLWIFSSRMRPRFAVSGMFMVLYGIFRFSVEFVRVPDAQIGYVALGWLTEGQILSVPMILTGVIALLWAYRGVKQCSNI